MIRAASWARARRRFSARGGSFFMVSEDRVGTGLWRIRGRRIDIRGADAGVALISLVGRQRVDAEILEHRIQVRVLATARRRVDLHLDDALRNRTRPLRDTAQ